MRFLLIHFWATKVTHFLKEIRFGHYLFCAVIKPQRVTYALKSQRDLLSDFLSISVLLKKAKRVSNLRPRPSSEFWEKLTPKKMDTSHLRTKRDPRVSYFLFVLPDRVLFLSKVKRTRGMKRTQGLNKILIRSMQMPPVNNAYQVSDALILGVLIGCW